MNPLEGVLGSFGTKFERNESMRKYREERLDLERKILSGETCPSLEVSRTAIQSDYDLRPR
jgi:hypothetical protein